MELYKPVISQNTSRRLLLMVLKAGCEIQFAGGCAEFMSPQFPPNLLKSVIIKFQALIGKYFQFNNTISKSKIQIYLSLLQQRNDQIFITINRKQKQPPEVFCKKRCYQKFHKIHRKRTARASFLTIWQTSGLQLYQRRDSDTGVFL